MVGEPLRDAFLAAVPSATAVEVDTNRYGVMAHGDALRAIETFVGPPEPQSAPWAHVWPPGFATHIHA